MEKGKNSFLHNTPQANKQKKWHRKHGIYCDKENNKEEMSREINFGWIETHKSRIYFMFGTGFTFHSPCVANFYMSLDLSFFFLFIWFRLSTFLPWFVDLLQCNDFFLFLFCILSGYRWWYDGKIGKIAATHRYYWILSKWVAICGSFVGKNAFKKNRNRSLLLENLLKNKTSYEKCRQNLFSRNENLIIVRENV